MTEAVKFILMRCIYQISAATQWQLLLLNEKQLLLGGSFWGQDQQAKAVVPGSWAAKAMVPRVWGCNGGGCVGLGLQSPWFCESQKTRQSSLLLSDPQQKESV